MKRTSLVALAAALGLLATSGPALAAGVAYPDADWTQATITNPVDGTKLHADVLRPKGFKDTDKTPVIVSIGPYFNHSGQTSAAGPVEGTSYDPVGPNAGPSERFADFVEGSRLLDPERPNGAYTFVMVDLRGFGGSTGCLDWGGPGEQSDVVAAVEWAGTQAWSTGAVGTYGKSYDGMTGLIAAANWAKAPHLKAVVSQEPVYDDYRYLYGDGIRRENFAATPALYDAISVTPGTLQEGDPTYNVNGAQENVQRPGCHAANWLDQAGNDDHYSPYWRARNLISEVKGSPTPLFVTQGMTENNTAPDGFAEFLANHTGPERGWLGPWNHVRGNDMDGSKLAMGRKGWFDEVMSFYDQYLKEITPSVAYPPFAIQSVTTGRWRPELQWPPADATTFDTNLLPGTYTDTAQGTRTGNTGVWTVSKPLPYDVQLAGAGTITLDVGTTVPRANLVVDLYDLDASGKGPLVARQGSLVRGNGPLTLRLMSADWKFAKGRRIGIRITDNNSDWWIAAIPTNATVSVYGGTASLPFLRYARTQVAQGDSGTTRAAWLSGTAATAPAAAVTGAVDFGLPPALAPEPADMQTALDAFQGK